MPLKSPLSPLEQEVMNAIWSQEKATAMGIQSALAPQRVLRDSTVRTLLTRLEEKGYVQHKVDGRTYVYSSTEPPRSLAVRAVRQIVDRFCHGSVESLLAGMVDGEIVDAEELQRIVDRLSIQQSVKGPRISKRKGKPK